MHKTPALVITPLSTALAGAGAMGWAVGSQPCMGNIPALVPKPITVMSSTHRSSGPCEATASGESVPPGTNRGVTALAVKKKMPSKPIIAPAMEYSRYFMPAATASLVRLCKTSATLSRVISSKHRYIVTSVPAKHSPRSALRVSR